MASWKKTITSPFRKACTFFNQQPREKKPQQGTITFLCPPPRSLSLKHEEWDVGFEISHVAFSPDKGEWFHTFELLSPFKEESDWLNGKQIGTRSLIYENRTQLIYENRTQDFLDLSSQGKTWIMQERQVDGKGEARWIELFPEMVGW